MFYVLLESGNCVLKTLKVNTTECSCTLQNPTTNPSSLHCTLTYLSQTRDSLASAKIFARNNMITSGKLCNLESF